MKTKSNCASDGSVTLANGFFEGNCMNLGLALGYLKIIFGEKLSFISLAIAFFTMIRCLLQFANLKYHVNGRFYKSIIRVHWISRQAYTVRNILIQD